MTYKLVQSFHINNYANHYLEIEITGYRVLYSKRFIGSGVVRLISWLAQEGQLTALIEFSTV